MKMIKLKKYTLDPKLLGLLIPIIISITLTIIILLTYQSIIALLVGLLVPLSIFLGTIGFIIKIIIEEYKLWKTSIYHDKYLMIRTDNLDSSESINCSLWVYDIKNPVITIINKLSPYINTNKNKLDFYTISIKQQVTMFVRGTKISARGLSLGTNSQIQYSQPDIMNSLLEHELAHLILNSMGYNNKSEKYHHEIMSKAGIN